LVKLGDHAGKKENSKDIPFQQKKIQLPMAAYAQDIVILVLVVTSDFLIFSIQMLLFLRLLPVFT
jgi:hypothetical protein